MIVLVIIASIFATFVPGLFSKSDRELRKEVRRIALLSKEIRNRAMLTKNTHRIVFNMTKEGVIFYPEEAQGKILLDTPEERLKFINSRNNFTEDELAEYQKKNPFKKIDRLTRRKKSMELMKELMIKQIELQGIKDKFTTGEVEIYYMPEGFVELAVIQVQTRDEALKWTLVTSPLTGHMDIFEGHLDLDTIEDRK